MKVAEVEPEVPVSPVAGVKVPEEEPQVTLRCWSGLPRKDAEKVRKAVWLVNMNEFEEASWVTKEFGTIWRSARDELKPADEAVRTLAPAEVT